VINLYYALHLPTGLETELIATDVESAKGIVRTADFYITNTNELSYTWYKQDTPWYINKRRHWLDKCPEQFEIRCSTGETFTTYGE